MLYHFSPSLFLLLPEVILTVTGILVMMLEPLIAPERSRKPLGWLAILGTFGSGLAAYDQLRVTRVAHTLTGFYGSLQVDFFSVFFHLLIAAIVLVTLLASLDYFEARAVNVAGDTLTGKAVSHAGEYFALVLFGATGMMFMTSSTELLMVFVGLEISSISTYILAGFRKGQATASESSLKYFLLGSFATAFFLYGIALAFGATGSTNISAIAAALNGAPTGTSSRLAILALAMILIGLGFKVSAAPFHVWTPDVYQGAPAPVVGLMSTAPKAAAFAVLLRILFNAMPTLRGHWIVLIVAIAIASMCIGNFGALLQRDVKRMLAYSSIAHAGYLLCAFTAVREQAVASACFYTAAYAAMNVGAFLVLTQLSGYNEESRTLEDFTGVAFRRPMLAYLLAFFLLSLIGIPFTGGFFGKFYAFSAAMNNGYAWLAVVGLLNSGLACFYYLRLLLALYTRPVVAAPGAEVYKHRFSAGDISLAATALATLALGVAPGKLLHLVQRAAPATLPVSSAVAPGASTLPPMPPTSAQ